MGDDAATQLQARVTENMLPEPPTGGRWYYVNSVTTEIEATQDQLNEIPVNYLDYKIFYAKNDPENGLTITDEEKCLSFFEMGFYEEHYTEYVIALEDEHDKSFEECVIYGAFTGFFDDPYEIYHVYFITVGDRYQEYIYPVDDITSVE